MKRPTYAIIDLSALADNIRAVQAHVGEGVALMAVVKANAYGHGIVEVSSAAVAAGARYLGVAIPEEGAALREAGITAPVLVLSGILPQSAEDVVNNNLSATVFTPAVLYALQEEAARRGRICRIHIKVDTGMNRVGVKSMEEFLALLDEIMRCPNICFEGLYTHFAESEIADKSFTRLQNARFQPYIQAARERGFSPLLHASNTGALLDMADAASYDIVRGGLAMYGYSPGPDCGRSIALTPVLTWRTSVMHIKRIGAGEYVSYGRRYSARTSRLIATLPVGYGDGYKYSLANGAEVLINGRRAPIVGTVCMDQCMADITDIDGVHVGDEVVLLGRQGDDCISAAEMAAWAETIGYEILLSISERVPRVYVNGKGVRSGAPPPNPRLGA